MPDQKHTFDCGGTLERHGNVVRAHWTHDVLGRPLKNGVETWTHRTQEEAVASFTDLVERWSE